MSLRKFRKINIRKLDPNMRSLKAKKMTTRWLAPDATPLRMTGFEWFAKDRVYRRLPVKPVDFIPPAVNALADCTAGGQISFRSNTRHVSVRVELTGTADMCHMPSTGQCGFDLYIGEGKSLKFYAASKYNLRQPRYEVQLFAHTEAEMRTFTLFFPLYMGVKSVKVGVDPDAAVIKPPSFAMKGKIIFYGTSITQGGCASRPGMAYTNILARRLNMETVNLGFSGNGRGEPELARLMADITQPRLFVLDYDANAGDATQMQRTLPEFIHILRERHAKVPLLVISRISFSLDRHQKLQRTERRKRRAVQAGVVAAARKHGDRRIFFVDGSTLLGKGDDECTVDGVHPTDLGFMRMADSLEPVFRKILLD